MSNYYDLIADGGVAPEVDSYSTIQAAMNNAASQRKTLLVPQYRFYSSQKLYIPSNLRIQGTGPRSAIWPIANIVLFEANTVDNWAIDGLQSEGFCAPNYENYYPDIPNNGQGFLRVLTCEDFSVSNLNLRRFAGIALSQEGGYLNEKKGIYQNIRGKECYTLLRCHNYGEYCEFFGVVGDRCTISLDVDSGNDAFFGCQGVNCRTGLKLTGGINHAHGQFNGCTFNHNNWNLEADDVEFGESLSGCHFIGGTLIHPTIVTGRIRLTNSRGINFNGGIMGSNITVDGGAGTKNGQNSMNGMHVFNYTDTVAPSITNGGLLSRKGNTQETSMWAYNN